jgi:hypothetical protein
VNGGGLFPLESSILGPFAAVQSFRASDAVLFRARLNRFRPLVLSRFKRLFLPLLLNLALHKYLTMVANICPLLDGRVLPLSAGRADALHCACEFYTHTRGRAHPRMARMTRIA